MLRDFRIQRADGTTQTITGISLAVCTGTAAGTLSIPAEKLTAQLGESNFRTPTGLEECLAVRSAVVDGQATPVMQTIDVDQIEERGASWQVSGDADFSQWHGAPVVSSRDGKIIGLLLSDSGATVIAKHQPRSAAE